MILDKLFKNSKGEYINIFDVFSEKDNISNYIYTLAEAHAIDLIAKTIAKCEIQTFELVGKNVQESKKDLYWTLNLQPNYNEYGTSFIYKLVTKLLINKTALVIINKTARTNLLYIAEEYNASDDILYEKTFKDISVLDDEENLLQIRKTYNQNNAIYYSLKNKEMISAGESFKTNTEKILKAIQKSFIKANTSKWRLTNPGPQARLRDIETNMDIDYKDYKNKITEGLISDDEAVVLLSQSFNLENLNKDNNKNLSDFDTLIVKIGTAVAQKWNIPTDVFFGNKTEKSNGTNDFITFAVDPYFELLEDGFNVSLVGKESYLKGEYVKFNRANINYKDLMDKTSGWDKLISNGFSFNQLCKLLGLPPIQEDWANKHYITKNYANVEGGAEENG